MRVNVVEPLLSMDAEKAREILWDHWSQMTDEDIEKIIALYRAISRIFISKM